LTKFCGREWRILPGGHTALLVQERGARETALAQFDFSTPDASKQPGCCVAKWKSTGIRQQPTWRIAAQSSFVLTAGEAATRKKRRDPVHCLLRIRSL
jgi:hypothetical protein